jgi:outer membrane protein OmpA-like peptidoglycan-associated protein
MPYRVRSIRRRAWARICGASAAVVVLSMPAACGDRKQTNTSQSASAGAPAPPSAGGSPGDAPSGSSAPAGGASGSDGATTPYTAACNSRNSAQPDPLPTVAPWSAGATNGRDTIPLRPGLTIVTAVATPDGDYESMKTVSGQTDAAVTLDVSAEVPKYDFMTKKTAPTHFQSRRMVLQSDQDTACGFAPVFHGKSASDPLEIDSGTTGTTFSARMLAALKTGQDQYVRVMKPDFGGGLTEQGQWVRRVEPHDVNVPVILNDQPVTLPAVHAQCDSMVSYTLGRNGAEVRHIECEYFVLDDPHDPILLVWRTMDLKNDTTLQDVPDSVLNGTDKTGFRTVGGVLQLDTTQLQVVHIANADIDLAGKAGGGGGGGGGAGGGAGAGAGAGGGAGGGAGAGSGAGGGAGASAEQRMEQALSRDRKVVVYGIYFDFAQATIKKQSGPVLHEIANLMQKNPSWSLSINGYTDSIGGDVYNLALSKRRAAAVRDTLVRGFRISAGRLSSSGFGSASPVDSNSTLEGRARNRRVELIRRD